MLRFQTVRDYVYFIFSSFSWRILLSLNVFVTLSWLRLLIKFLISPSKNLSEFILFSNWIQLQSFFCRFVNIWYEINYVRIVWFWRIWMGLIEVRVMLIRLKIIGILFSNIMRLIMNRKIHTICIMCILNWRWDFVIISKIGVRIMFSVAFCSLYRLNIPSIFKVSYCKVRLRIGLKHCLGRWWIYWKGIFVQ